MYTKRHKKAMIFAALLIFAFWATLAGCGNRQADAMRKEAREINENSTLPMALLTSNAEANPAAYEDYFENFTSLDYRGKDFTLIFCSFPTDEDGYFLTGINWTGEAHDLFGIKVGDDPAKASEALQAWGYALTDGGYIAEFEKKGVVVWIYGDTAIEEIKIDIPTEFTRGNVY